MMRLLGILCLGVFALAACGKPASDTEPVTEPEVTVQTEAVETPEVDPKVDAAFAAYEAWRADILKGDGPLSEDWQKQMRDMWRASQKETDPFRRELAERVTYDQFPRVAQTHSPAGQDAVLAALEIDLDVEQRIIFGRKLVGDWLMTDQRNVAWLRDIYEERGAWFPISEVGEQAAKNAWLIVQHATDDPFLMARVLADMELMVQDDEADPSNFALLYDRVNMRAGKPQRYGTQFTCQGGIIQPHEIEDEFDLDIRRKSVGLGPMAEYSKRFAGQTC